MLGVGKSHARCSRETKVAVASVVVDGDAQARGHGKHDRVSRWLSASIRTCRKSHFELMRGAMFHTARRCESLFETPHGCNLAVGMRPGRIEADDGSRVRFRCCTDAKGVS